MQYFDLVLSFTALFGLCAFLTLKARLHSALAPLAALGITGIWFTLVGVADLLVAGGWVFSLAAWGPVSYTHLTLPTIYPKCRSRWSPYH